MFCIFNDNKIYMTSKEAQKLGRTKTLKATAIVWSVLIFLFLFGQTKGHLINGNWEFISSGVIINFLILLIVLFGLTYYFGGYAGIEIIIEKKNAFNLTLKYATLIALAISVYGISFALIKESTPSTNVSVNRLIVSFFALFFKNAFFLFIIWLWSTNKMKSVSKII